MTLGQTHKVIGVSLPVNAPYRMATNLAINEGTLLIYQPGGWARRWLASCWLAGCDGCHCPHNWASAWVDG